MTKPPKKLYSWLSIKTFANNLEYKEFIDKDGKTKRTFALRNERYEDENHPKKYKYLLDENGDKEAIETKFVDLVITMKKILLSKNVETENTNEKKRKRTSRSVKLTEIIIEAYTNLPSNKKLSYQEYQKKFLGSKLESSYSKLRSGIRYITGKLEKQFGCSFCNVIYITDKNGDTILGIEYRVKD